MLEIVPRELLGERRVVAFGRVPLSADDAPTALENGVTVMSFGLVSSNGSPKNRGVCAACAAGEPRWWHWTGPGSRAPDQSKNHLGRCGLCPADVSPEALFCPSCGNPTARDALTITGSEDVTCLAARVPVATGIEYTTARWSGDGEIRQTEAERRRLQSRMSEERYGTS